jgi:mRNA-degrading endonuclease YafQ of YafQ-DinJ toxin-antitoxin module
MYYWLWENITPKRVVMITKRRFVKDYGEFSRKYSNLKDALLNFVRFRLNSRPDQPYNNKDSPMATAPGFRRCHLVHGKAILIYRIEGNELQLCAIVEHNSVETGRELTVLGDYLEKLSPENFEHAASFETAAQNNTDKPDKLPANIVQDIKTVIWTLAAEDKTVLVKALNGDMSELIEYFEIAIEDMKLPSDEIYKSIQATFTKEEFHNLIKNIMNQVKL